LSETATHNQGLRPRIIRGINRRGLYTLIKKEIKRFLAVFTQTIVAPVVTTLLFYAVFALALGGLTKEINGISYLEFLAPGLIMMSMVQNAFANTSSSIMISKVQGNIVDVLMPPLSAGELYLGYAIGGIVRGLLVGVCCTLAVSLFVEVPCHSLLYIFGFAVLGTMMLASLGIVGGVWSEKFDHIAAITNFVVTPLTFLSGTFYSIHRLPEVWQAVAFFNPFFHMIDGFRFGFIGQSDGNPWFGLGILIIVNIILAAIGLWMFRSGYKIRS